MNNNLILVNENNESINNTNSLKSQSEVSKTIINSNNSFNVSNYIINKKSNNDESSNTIIIQDKIIKRDYIKSYNLDLSNLTNYTKISESKSDKNTTKLKYCSRSLSNKKTNNYNTSKLEYVHTFGKYNNKFGLNSNYSTKHNFPNRYYSSIYSNKYKNNYNLINNQQNYYNDYDFTNVRNLISSSDIISVKSNNSKLSHSKSKLNEHNRYYLVKDNAKNKLDFFSINRYNCKSFKNKFSDNSNKKLINNYDIENVADLQLNKHNELTSKSKYNI